MRPRDVELVRLSRTDGRIRIGVAVVALLLLAAVVKPWSGPGPAGTTGSAPVIQSLASDRAADASSSASPPAVASGLCVSPDGWRVVADDVELGRSVRTWLVADVEYSTTPPARSTIPVTTLVSSQVERLGFCLPAGGGAPGTNGWSGTLWRAADASLTPAQGQEAATLDPAPGSLGAMAYPVGEAALTWAPGLYFLQADFAGSNREAWLGLLIEPDLI